ncbi:hypothetical protein RFI_19953 [Reticulomyxa filosa]|uniref:Uncharacterized protein n=1 Tax=Reticulomyxa filosa TaxID=46433 RepID=X6MTV1_RETFI|nr:hypothetical protein RFI_19953 [Reticulomyxa filosa]|eukprot:ETO17368.1 hypothetical protein RFI_19953 [Reticulomyxa filosa]
MSINHRIGDNPNLLLTSENREKIEYKWLFVIKWINKSCKPLDRKPIVDGKYGEWFDSQQYLDWLKDSGQYKKWQWDEIDKLYQSGTLRWFHVSTLPRDSSSSSKFFPYTNSASKQQLPSEDQPLLLEQTVSRQEVLDRKMKAKIQKNAWKPKWWPF